MNPKAWQRFGAAIACAASAMWATPVFSAQSTAPFRVTVALRLPGSPPPSAFCRLAPGSNTFGAIVTVVCSTGAVVNIEASKWGLIHGGAYRFTHVADNVFSGLQFPGGIDIYTGLGTVTTWRVVNSSERDWDYLEMQMAW